MITSYEKIEEYENEYRVHYFEKDTLKYKYEDVIASSKEGAINDVKSMKGLDIGIIDEVKLKTEKDISLEDKRTIKEIISSILKHGDIIDHPEEIIFENIILNKFMTELIIMLDYIKTVENIDEFIYEEDNEFGLKVSLE